MQRARYVAFCTVSIETTMSAPCPYGGTMGGTSADDGVRRAGVSTVAVVPVVRHTAGAGVMAAPTTTGKSDAHRGEISHHDEMRGEQGRRAWKSIFTDESESEDGARPCARKRARAESDESGDVPREPSRQRVDSTDAPT